MIYYSFGYTVVTGYQMQLEEKHLALPYVLCVFLLGVYDPGYPCLTQQFLDCEIVFTLITALNLNLQILEGLRVCLYPYDTSLLVGFDGISKDSIFLIFLSVYLFVLYTLEYLVSEIFTIHYFLFFSSLVNHFLIFIFNLCRVYYSFLETYFCVIFKVHYSFRMVQ